MEKVCRLCGESTNKFMYNVFSKNENGQQIIHLIKQCLPILIYRSDPLSKEICTTCYTKLNEFSSFRNNTRKVHDKFKENLITRSDESPVKLYINSLESVYEYENNNLSSFQSPRLVRNNASQIQVETRTNFTNTLPESIEILVPPRGGLKILTPLVINEKSNNENKLITLQSQDGSVQKKRKLAGPKCKTRILQRALLGPPSLLQCALKQINRNLNLLDEFSVSDNTSETVMETETSDYSMSRSESQDRDVFTPEMIIEPDLSMMFDSEFISNDEPTVCNYCMKNVNNIVDLAQHEINHMKVDIGPRVDSKRFKEKCRKFSSYYMNYLARIARNTPSPLPKRETRPRSELQQAKVVKSPPLSAYRRTLVDDENSLLIPQQHQFSNYELVIDDYKIFVNGTLLKDLPKEERKLCYKDMLINGIKRKFCPLCRHTFKDNWAIENHYLNDACQYTCKYCGRKFKHQKELYESHLLNHKNEPINKIFGPADRRHKLKKKLKRNNKGIIVARRIVNTPTVKPMKMKQLMQKKLLEPEVQIKTEPDDAVPSASNIKTRTEPYQAYFCRKCFKVFFNVGEYNVHIQACIGPTKSKSDTKSVTSETSSISETQSKRPVRSCVKDFSALNDSEVDSDDNSRKSNKFNKSMENGFECGVCCSSFPSRQSRNSHMRIHKGQQNVSPKPVINKISPKSHTVTRQESPVPSNPNYQNSDIRLSNLNPAVARLVQNNPHLTIRTYSKSQVQKYQQEQSRNKSSEPPTTFEPSPTTTTNNEATPEHNIKRVYKCADCEDKFENKSILYYHKMNSCIVKRHYECAFCRKKFGTYDQYNTHMFYVHPE